MTSDERRSENYAWCAVGWVRWGHGSPNIWLVGPYIFPVYLVFLAYKIKIFATSYDIFSSFLFRLLMVLFITLGLLSPPVWHTLNFCPNNPASVNRAIFYRTRKTSRSRRRCWWKTTKKLSDWFIRGVNRRRN